MNFFDPMDIALALFECTALITALGPNRIPVHFWWMNTRLIDPHGPAAGSVIEFL